jgi:hypothetical protein
MTLNSDALATKRVIYQQRKPAGEQKGALKELGIESEKREMCGTGEEKPVAPRSGARR